jgi:hypothetical protein
MMTDTSDLLDFYARPGVMTDPGKHADLLAGLPGDVGALCKVVQQNLVHVFWAERYGRTLSEAEKGTLNVRPISGKLALMRQAGERPLLAGRALERRQVGNCRDFSLLLTTFLRQQGRPARARCGFGAYFLPEHFEDHWVCEYWNTELGRWVLVDAQLDELQRGALEIGFDPLDVPRDQFVIAGRAWQMCREGRADPKQFGIFDMHGWWFIWGDVVRDFLSLNKVEILPWDHEVGAFSHRLEDPFPDDQAEIAFCDRIAALTLSGEEAFGEVRREYEREARWHAPESWWEGS